MKPCTTISHYFPLFPTEYCVSLIIVKCVFKLTCVGSSGLGKMPLQSLSRGERQAFSLECLCLSDGSGEANEEE